MSILPRTVVQEDAGVTFTELIIVPAYVSAFFLIAALAQLLLGAPLYAAITSIALSVGSLANYTALVLGTREKLIKAVRD